VCKKLIKNSYPFGKNVRKPQGDFLTHTVHTPSGACHEWMNECCGILLCCTITVALSWHFLAICCMHYCLSKGLVSLCLLNDCHWLIVISCLFSGRQIARHIVTCLGPYRRPDCEQGRINTTNDFKRLARKVPSPPSITYWLTYFTPPN